MPKLTEAAIRRALSLGIDPTRPYTMLWDSDPTGLGLRMRSTGAHSWVYKYRAEGGGRSAPVRWVTLGSYPSLDLAMARDAAKKLVAKVVDGADPAQDVKREKGRERRVLSIVLEHYATDMKRRKLVNAGQIESALKRGLSGLMNREVDSLTRADVVTEIKKLVADKPGAASYLRTCARTFLEWCVSQGIAPHNVMAGLQMPKATRAERLADKSRTGRALSDAEIVKVWAACEAFKPLGGLVRLGLLTAMRRNELAGLEWSDVKGDRIVVEAERAKTGARHEIPMTVVMRAVINAQPKTKGGLVFGSLKAPGEPISGWSKMVPRLVKASGVTFTLHDLRRTARTLMSRLGVPEDAAELAIGHARADLVARYNKDDAWQARVDAFAKVSDHIAGLVARDAPAARPKPSKIVSRRS